MGARAGRRRSVARVAWRVPDPAARRRRTNLLRRQFAGPATARRPAGTDRRTRRLGEAGRGRPPARAASVVAVSPGRARRARRSRRRGTRRSGRDEFADCEPPSPDGEFLSAEALIELDGDEPGGTLSTAAIERALAQHGKRIALVLLPGVQYLTGQSFDIEAITKLAHAQGCTAGFDCAHAAGNIDLALHDSGCDFAAWCSYKYLNSGPGAVAGAFVHARHAHAKLPRFEGWWGRDEATRFQMRPEFDPAPGAEGWQLSNPPILALAPLRVSLELFQRAGMQKLRSKSLRLTSYLAWL